MNSNQIFFKLKNTTANYLMDSRPIAEFWHRKMNIEQTKYSAQYDMEAQRDIGEMFFL